jgi:hypothetical protein
MSNHSLIKVIEFAKLAGVGKTAVYKARDTEKITITNGLIDLTNPKTLEYLQAAKRRKELEREARENAIATTEDAIKFLPSEAREASGENGNRIPSEKSKLETARIEKQNRELDLKYAKERNELLSRDSVAQVFNKLYSIQVSKLHGFSHAVTPDLAVIFESTDNEKMIQTTELINNAMFSVLEEIKKTMDGYLESIKGEDVEV